MGLLKSICMLACAALLGAALLAAQPAAAQATKKPFLPCGAGLAQNHGAPSTSGLIRVAAHQQGVTGNHIRLTFSGHSTFTVETPGGAKVITDYNDYVRPPGIPDIVTMNTGHDTHSNENVDAAIKFVLRGWKYGGGIARHDVRFKDLRVYSIPINIGNLQGSGPGFAFFNNASIFVIQAAGLCVVHMGNIRHALNDDQIAQMGRVDVVMIPVDRFITSSFEEVMFNLKRMRPRLIIPMHLNDIQWGLDFAAEAQGVYEANIHPSPTLVFSRASLPRRTEILILPLADAGGSTL